MAVDLQTIPARHGVATFVPAGQTIKIINTSGTQVVDTWAFALPKPEEKRYGGEQDQNDETKDEDGEQNQQKPKTNQRRKAPFPSQEEAERATKGQFAKSAREDAQNQQDAQKSTWGSYVPSLSNWTMPGASSESKQIAGSHQEAEGETEQQKNSRTWASYFPSGRGISSYVPKKASDSVSAFAALHHRDQSKSYLAQLHDFSKTPVGSAGLAAISGSGYGGSLYAGYQAWNAKNAANAPQMEVLSMMQTRAVTLHLRPRVNDTLVTNVRDPILTLLEDSSGGIHDTLIPACTPNRYRDLGIEEWAEHGSCAENLVLALKELNETAGLKGAKSVGADVTVNSAPAPLNLFMNIPWDDDGNISMDAPKCRKGGFVRFRAERDVVVVMSACPQDIIQINGGTVTDAHFVVEDESTVSKLRKTQTPATKASALRQKRAPAPRKLSSANTGLNAQSNKTPAAARKKPVPPQVKPQTKTAESMENQQKVSPQAQSILESKTAPRATKVSSPVERKKPRKLASRSQQQ